MHSQQEQRRVIELDLQHARYEASLAERRYAACDPENRLIAAQLEKNWEAALQRVHGFATRLQETDACPPATVTGSDLMGLAQDLDSAWNAPFVTTRARQQLMRTLIVDIIADVDETTRDANV